MGKMTDWWGIWMDGVMWGGCGLKQKGYLIFDTKSPRALHLWLWHCPAYIVNCQKDLQRRLWWPRGPHLPQQTLTLFTPSCLPPCCASVTLEVWASQGNVATVMLLQARLCHLIQFSNTPASAAFVLGHLGHWGYRQQNSIQHGPLLWVFLPPSPISRNEAVPWVFGFLYSPLIPSTVWYCFQPHFLEPREGLGALLAPSAGSALQNSSFSPAPPSDCLIAAPQCCSHLLILVPLLLHSLIQWGFLAHNKHS